MRRIGIRRSAPRFVYRVRETRLRLYEHLLYVHYTVWCSSLSGKESCCCNLPQYGRRQADPNVVSAGQFPPARPEQDSPHWRVNASPRLILALDSPRLLPDLSAFFSSLGGLFLFSLFRYSHHLAETAADWWANCSSSLLETSPRGLRIQSASLLIPTMPSFMLCNTNRHQRRQPPCWGNTWTAPTSQEDGASYFLPAFDKCRQY